MNRRRQNLSLVLFIIHFLMGTLRFIYSFKKVLIYMFFKRILLGYLFLRMYLDSAKKVRPCDTQ